MTAMMEIFGMVSCLTAEYRYKFAFTAAYSNKFVSSPYACAGTHTHDIIETYSSTV